MPKTIYLPRDAGTQNWSNHSGIDITWTKTANRLDIGGWYDSFVGISGASLFLREFFDLLGITKKDCEKAFKNETCRT